MTLLTLGRVTAVAAALLLSGCAAQPAPSPSASASGDDLAGFSSEVLDLNDAVEAAQIDLAGQLNAIVDLNTEDPTDCRVAAESRVIDQILEVIEKHQVALGALFAGEKASGKPDAAALATASSDLAELQKQVDGNDDALASCEKEATP